MSERSSALTNAINMLVSPMVALRALKENPTFAFPYLLILVGAVAVILWYYSGVDLGWMISQTQQVSSTDPAVIEQQRAAIDAIDQLPPLALGSIAAAGSAIFLTIIYVLYAFYLRLVAMVTGDSLNFRAAFSLICWTSIPTLLGVAATLANLAINDIEFLRPDRLNPLSFASLLGIDAAGGGTLSQFTTSMGVTNIWAFGLAVLGHSIWTEKGIGRSALIVLAPPAVLFALIYVLLPSPA